MVKKEVAEIRKLMSPEKNVFTVLRGCYVSANDKRRISITKEAFLSIADSEAVKYLELFKKSLSGKIGKTLHEIPFPMEEEKEGGIQTLLYRLRETKLEDDSVLDEFYDAVIGNYNYGENYYIVLAYGIYDVPGKDSNGQEMEDMSDSVFPFFSCCICPVNLSDPGLGYQEKANRIGDCSRGWMVGTPDAGFLFPLFTDRQADIHGVLYYSRKDEGLYNGLVDGLLKCEVPSAPKEQKEMFVSIVGGAFGDACTLEKAVAVQESICGLDEGDEVTGTVLKGILEENGAVDVQMPEGLKFSASNVVESGYKVKAGNVSIQANPETASRISEQSVHGQRCLVIPLEGEVTVNGITVYAG